MKKNTRLWGWMLPLALAFGAGCSDDADSYAIEFVDGNRFKASEHSVEDRCAETYESLTPAADAQWENYAVTLKFQDLEEQFPWPQPVDEGQSGDRDELRDPDHDAKLLARANGVLGYQACTLKQLHAIGGRYQSSDILVNAFFADLTEEQAALLGEHPDVGYVELTQKDTPPPM